MNFEWVMIHLFSQHTPRRTPSRVTFFKETRSLYCPGRDLGDFDSQSSRHDL
jgi:hypothetical protein